MMRLAKVEEGIIKGFALGTTSHAIGTARALQYGEDSAAFAALAMGLNGLTTALLLPLIVYAWT
jgi:putative effector of murein hydrolase